MGIPLLLSLFLPAFAVHHTQIRSSATNKPGNPRSLHADPVTLSPQGAIWEGLVTPSVHRSESADSATCTTFCLTPFLPEGSTATGLVGHSPAAAMVTNRDPCPDSSPHGSVCCAGDRIMCVSDPCFTARGTMVGGVRLLPAGYPEGKDSVSQVSLGQEAPSAPIPASGKEVSHRAAKKVKETMGDCKVALIQTALPAFAVPFTDFRDVQPVGEHSQNQRSDL